MTSDFSDPLLADAFRNLNASDPLPKLTQRAIWASWASLFLLAALLLVIFWLVVTSDREAESIRLQQSTDTIARALETRVTRTAEILQNLSMRLMHTPRGGYALASADLSAATIMANRRELIEIALATDSGDVLHAWRSKTSQAAPVFSTEIDVRDAPTLRAIRLVTERERSASTSFYSSADTNRVFINIVVPTPSRSGVLIGRIDLTALLKLSEDRRSTGQYRFGFLLNDRPVEENATARLAAGTEFSAPLSASTPISFLTPLPGERMAICAQSYDHALFATNRVQYFVVGGLAFLLVLAMGAIFYFQRHQHRSQQLLAREFSLRRAMSESSVVGLRVTDLSGKILYVNETFTRIVGYPASELLEAEPPYPYWTEDLLPKIRAAIGKSPESVEAIRFEARRRNGESFWAELRLSSMLDESGEVLGSIGALFDVTPLVLARQRLEDSNERFTCVVESMMSAIAVFTEPDRSTLLFANRSYRTLFGDRADGGARLLETLGRVKPVARANGVFDETTGRWFDIRLQPIVWTHSESAVMMIASDITERRELELAREAQLRRTESTHRLVTMGEMASSLAHELNQPLAAIANYANAAATMLAAGTLSREREAQSFERIEKQAQRAGRIIQRIRGFAKKTDAKPEPVAVETVIEETLELANIQARKLESSIALSVPAGLPLIQGDGVMLEQLLLNLLKNAMEACAEANLPPEKRRVELIAAIEPMDPGRLRFSVVDHGPGIPEDMRPTLFDAFYSTKNEGMGMGLNICRSIAELHGGELVMRPTDGGGSTFSFTVPVIRAESAA